MTQPVHFEAKSDFHQWLTENHQTNSGIWLLFSKDATFTTLKASEALEEALCHGWIDGVMKKIDEHSYMKYFAPRRKNSRWSEKNKKIVQKLIDQDLVTEFGLQKISEAKANGQWDQAVKPSAITPEQIETVADLLKENALAYQNFQTMSPSVQKTYTRAYFDAKTDKGRDSRLKWMTERLIKNLKPM
ncbi:MULTISPECIES: YdeI/OmpD-associated family protein [Enterococcus]|uniref:YdeI/OmpD-associated family protein n=1 Tax=Enterococcus alishanensis TaxID=1303817 RepID=A0ABS6TD84_9ENTE|nr:YdeI/OmpD-associated family protein [Enterococcus alishanensis]MBV7390840.1 YdeI/OmpD-associated family protein [Enterococcus alishanensis]